MHYFTAYSTTGTVSAHGHRATWEECAAEVNLLTGTPGIAALAYGPIEADDACSDFGAEHGDDALDAWIAELEAEGCASCLRSAEVTRARAEHGTLSLPHVAALKLWGQYRTADGRTLHTPGCPNAVEFSLIFQTEVNL